MIVVRKDLLPPRRITFRGRTLIFDKRAVLDCGCCVWVGMIEGTKEGGTIGVPCHREHELLITRFRRRWELTIDLEPKGREALEVAAEYLQKTALEFDKGRGIL